MIYYDEFCIQNDELNVLKIDDFGQNQVLFAWNEAAVFVCDWIVAFLEVIYFVQNMIGFFIENCRFYNKTCRFDNTIFNFIMKWRRWRPVLASRGC